MKSKKMIYIMTFLFASIIWLTGDICAEPPPPPDDVVVELPSTDGSHGFQVKDGALTSLMGVWSDGNVGIGTTSPAEKLSVAGTIESTSGGIKFPDGTTQTTAALPLVINATRPNPGSQTTFTAASLFTLDFDEIPGTQIRLVFRGSLTGPTATTAFYRLTTNQSWPIAPIEITGSIVSTTSSTPVFLDTGWITYTKPTGIATLAIQARVDATAGVDVDYARLTAPTIWFK